MSIPTRPPSFPPLSPPPPTTSTPHTGRANPEVTGGSFWISQSPSPSPSSSLYLFSPPSSPISLLALSSQLQSASLRFVVAGVTRSSGLLRHPPTTTKTLGINHHTTLINRHPV